jgi:enolase-phosphatase E1
MVKAVLTDIEGTTSSLSFVKDVLFPYSRERLPHFVRTHRHDPNVRAILNEAKILSPESIDVETLIQQFLAWIDQDKKITPLKALQGLIWEHGYANGDFTGHVYDDAAQQLRAWKARGLKLFVYSSGSVYAQKLLFGHTPFGDLTPLFSGYFDTTVGHKREAASYQKIAEVVGLPADEILFLSDIPEELDAAKAARVQTGWLQRPTDSPAPTNAGAVAPVHPVYKSFDEIVL